MAVSDAFADQRCPGASACRFIPTAAAHLGAGAGSRPGVGFEQLQGCSYVAVADPDDGVAVCAKACSSTPGCCPPLEVIQELRSLEAAPPVGWVPTIVAGRPSSAGAQAAYRPWPGLSPVARSGQSQQWSFPPLFAPWTGWFPADRTRCYLKDRRAPMRCHCPDPLGL